MAVSWEEKKAKMREVVMRLDLKETTNVSKLIKASGLSTHGGRIILEQFQGEGLITMERVGAMILVRRVM